MAKKPIPLPDFTVDLRLFCVDFQDLMGDCIATESVEFAPLLTHLADCPQCGPIFVEMALYFIQSLPFPVYMRPLLHAVKGPMLAFLKENHARLEAERNDALRVQLTSLAQDGSV